LLTLYGETADDLPYFFERTLKNSILNPEKHTSDIYIKAVVGYYTHIGSFNEKMQKIILEAL
jgi:hypothetical protein